MIKYLACLSALAIALLSLPAAHAQSSLWGVTQNGGVNSVADGYSAGTIFEYNPATGVYTKWFDFSQADGYAPQGNLLYHNGKLYGMTSLGGNNGGGVLFAFDPVTKVYSRKVDFTIGTGTSPEGGGLTACNGKLYGMTRLGGQNDRGTIFEYNPATNAIGVIYHFEVAALGYQPNGSLMVHNGLLYGLTGTGGVNGYGALFYIDPVGLVPQAPYYFSLSSGIAPLGGPMEYNGRLYAATANYGGGTSNGKGTIFSYDLSGGATDISTEYQFFVADSGDTPCGDLTACGGKLYGLTTNGGVNGRGVLYAFDPATQAFSVKHDFDGNTFFNGPRGSLTLYEGRLYGTTYRAGDADSGVLFSYEPATGVYAKLYDFDGINGASPAYSKLTIAPATATGVADRHAAACVQVYPNPAQDAVYITLSILPQATVVLTDMAGREVSRQDIFAGQSRIGLGGAPAGVYSCRVLDEAGRLLAARQVVRE